MDRRKFLKGGIGAGLLPVIMNGFSLNAFAESPLIQFLGKAGNNDRVLVLIQLNGGNDGLNTVIPIDQYSNLNAARSNIIINENKVLSLSGTQSTGLHPALSELRTLYDEGKIGIIQSVGYPNPDFSHFRATDIWLTASESNQFIDSGWMGRYLDTKFPNFPNNYPNTDFPDPPAIQIGPMVSPALQGMNASLGMSITDPKSFYQFVSGTVDPAPNTPAGHELTFVRLVAQQTQQYSGSIKTAAGKATNLSTLYPTTGQNSLADQLKIVAQLIAGGLKTKVYMVSLGGFDTHSTQSVNGASDTGVHANLLKKVSQAILAFQDDIQKLNIADKVLGMTFSEFGRRIKSNASLGTDHGAAAPLFMFGNKVKGGLYGSNPNIPANVGTGDNIPMQFDFRQVYASILKDWFEVSETDLNTLLMKSFVTIPVIDGSATGIQSKINEQSYLDNFPNPASDYTVIRFKIPASETSICLFDNSGKEISVVLNEFKHEGNYELKIDTSGLSQGNYYYQLRNNFSTITKILLISR
jgi:uncharacterized protein (DUF1501 family)